MAKPARQFDHAMQILNHYHYSFLSKWIVFTVYEHGNICIAWPNCRASFATAYKHRTLTYPTMQECCFQTEREKCRHLRILIMGKRKLRIREVSHDPKTQIWSYLSKNKVKLRISLINFVSFQQTKIRTAQKMVLYIRCFNNILLKSKQTNGMLIPTECDIAKVIFSLP